MRVSLIWAMAAGGVIGRDNDLPWSKLPADMRWFRRHTLGKPVVMGRRTFESFGARPLPERRNIVISRDPGYKAGDATVVASLEEALAAAGDVEEVMVIGGASIYAQALARADRLYVTEVGAELEGDARFPAVDWKQWQVIEHNEQPADARHPYPCTFRIYERAGARG